MSDIQIEDWRLGAWTAALVGLQADLDKALDNDLGGHEAFIAVAGAKGIVGFIAQEMSDLRKRGQQ